jgi:hypothetical protein
VETWWWLDGSSLVPKTDLPRSAFSYNASGSQIYVAVLRRVLVGALPEDPRAIARSLPPSLAVLVLWLVIGGAVSGGWTGVAWCRRLVTPKDGSSSGVPNGGRWRTALGVSGVSAVDPIALAQSRRNLAWTGPPSLLSAQCLPRRELLNRWAPGSLGGCSSASVCSGRAAAGCWVALAKIATDLAWTGPLSLLWTNPPLCGLIHFFED